MYIQATMKLRYGALEKLEQLGPRIRPIVERAGWELVCAMASRTGRLFTVVHLWKVRDLAQYEAGLAAFAGHPEGAKLFAELSECIDEENIMLGESVSYAPKSGR